LAWVANNDWLLIHSRKVALALEIARISLGNLILRFLGLSAITDYTKRSTSASLSVRFSRTILEFHALSSDDGTVLAIESLACRTLGRLGRDTILGDLVEDRSRGTLGSLVGRALFTVELESPRALWLTDRRAAFSIQIGTFGTDWFAMDTYLAVESKFTAIRDCNGNTLAVLEGESGFTVYLINADAPATLPNKVLRALWGLDTLTASVSIFLACSADRQTVDTVAILEVRVGGTLRRRWGQA
jgi:hypothetical protein